MKSDTLEFAAYVFRIVASSWLTVALIRMKCLSISLDEF